MRRVLAAMGGTLLAIAIGLTIYAGAMDDRQFSDQVRDAVFRDAGLGSQDIGPGGSGFRYAAGGAAVVGGVLLVGAAAAGRD